MKRVAIETKVAAAINKALDFFEIFIDTTELNGRLYGLSINRITHNVTMNINPAELNWLLDCDPHKVRKFVQILQEELTPHKKYEELERTWQVVEITWKEK